MGRYVISWFAPRAPVPAGQPDRVRRGGRGVAGDRPGTGPAGRGEAAAGTVRRACRDAGPVPGRGPACWGAVAPGHRPGLRLRGGGPGLAAVHAAGLVHRDIKPANLLMAPGGGVKITDFGIAHAAGSAQLTRTGMLVGTPAYLAPERAAGERASPASDLYSLGIVAYECLAAVPPFRGTPLEIAAAITRQPIPPLPASVPGPVAALVAELTARDPAGQPVTRAGGPPDAAVAAPLVTRADSPPAPASDELPAARANGPDGTLVGSMATLTGVDSPGPAARRWPWGDHAGLDRLRADWAWLDRWWPDGSWRRWAVGLTAAVAGVAALVGWLLAGGSSSSQPARSATRPAATQSHSPAQRVEVNPAALAR